MTLKIPHPVSAEAEPYRQLIDAILCDYHTTRLAETEASVHILSKPRTQAAFRAFVAAIDQGPQ